MSDHPWNVVADQPPPYQELVMARVRSVSGKIGFAVAQVSQGGEWFLESGEKMTWAAAVTHWVRVPESAPVPEPQDAY